MFRMIFVWRKDRDRDHTALRAIPMCPPHQNCVAGTQVHDVWMRRLTPAHLSMHATLAGGSAAFNITHDSIAPSPDYQQRAPKKPARGSRKVGRCRLALSNPRRKRLEPSA